MKSLGDFFRNRRIESHQSLVDVASSVDLTAAQLEEYEAGVRDMPFDMVFALSNVLNIGPNEVIQIVQAMGDKAETQRRSFAGLKGRA